jgi:hypothetical protein
MIFGKRKYIKQTVFSFKSGLRYNLILVVIALASYCVKGFGQQQAKNAVYLEAASKGPVYSINYDRIIRQGDKLAYSLRAGFSVEKNAVSFPVGINFITGQNDHHAEFSLTIIPYIDRVDKNSGLNNDATDKYFFINPAIGYRFQKMEKGIFIKASVGPSIFLDPPANDFWNMDPKVYAFGSISAGFSF